MVNKKTLILKQKYNKLLEGYYCIEHELKSTEILLKNCNKLRVGCIPKEKVREGFDSLINSYIFVRSKGIRLDDAEVIEDLEQKKKQLLGEK